MPDPIALPRIPRVRGAAARSSTWWGRAFVRSFEETAVDAADLATARKLARSGRLGSVVVLESMASAVVEVSTHAPLVAQLKVDPLPASAWSTLATEAARESGYAAALESGELPAELVEHVDEAGVEVLPGPGDLDTACGCEAWAQPCVHALALLYQLAWHIDADPYVLMLLRGRTRESLLAEVAMSSGPGEDDSPASELPESLADAGERARLILALAEDAPAGHGLADAAVASYDEAVSRLL